MNDNSICRKSTFSYSLSNAVKLWMQFYILINLNLQWQTYTKQATTQIQRIFKIFICRLLKTVFNEDKRWHTGMEGHLKTHAKDLYRFWLRNRSYLHVIFVLMMTFKFRYKAQYAIVNQTLAHEKARRNLLTSDNTVSDALFTY